ncbi:MAG: tetratricopeptide repeat protein [Planctomycetota bacterium]
MDNYDNRIKRAELLLSQDRLELAEESLRAAIGEDPDRYIAFALLALVHVEQKMLQEAQALAERALGLAPDEPFAHYALSLVLFHRDKNKEAGKAIDDAIARDPSNPDFLAHRAAIDTRAHAWKEALAAAEKGLQFDPRHVGCNNWRAIALTKLGRRDEASATIDSALAASPENATSHANMGWTQLHGGNAETALEHFKEALRLDPDHGWAREGIIESLKAKNFFYRQILRYMLWISRFSAQTQMMMFIGIIILLQVLVRMPDGSVLEKVGLVLAFTYMLFVASIWLASPLFDLLLSLSRYGRMTLTDEKRADSYYMAIALGFVATLCFVPILFGFRTQDVINYVMLLIPVAITLSTPREAKRSLAAGLTIAIFAVAIWYCTRWYAYPGIDGLNGPGKMIEYLQQAADDDPKLQEIFSLAQGQRRLHNLFVWPSVLMTWLSGFFHRRSL